MDANPYAAPQSAVADVEESGATTLNPRFYVVSTRKFVLLYVSTFGLYLLYWFYRNWRQYRDASGEDLWPLPRTIFQIFFVHGLFQRINDAVFRADASVSWSHQTHATWMVLMMVAGKLVDRLPELPAVAGPGLSLLLSLFLLIGWIKAQRMINLACGDVSGASNQSLSGANWAWMVFGMLFWGLVLFGMLRGA